MQPFHSNEIPDEMAGLEFANQAARTITGENKYDPHYCEIGRIAIKTINAMIGLMRMIAMIVMTVSY